MKNTILLIVTALLQTINICVNAQSLPTTELEVNKNYIVVATWNIGHFSRGSKMYSTITKDNYEQQLEAFRKIVYEDISPDLLCVNELSPIFGKDEAGMEQSVATTLFDGFEIKEIHEQLEYSCNALFSNLPIKHARKNSFKCSRPYLNEVPMAANYYYLSGEFKLNHEKIIIVCAHLIPKAENSELRSQQMLELIEKYKKYDKVIMCGDWNTNNFAVFKNAGYTLVNDKQFITYPVKSYFLDNIIVKGLKISDAKAIETNLSDHYPLVCKIMLD